MALLKPYKCSMCDMNLHCFDRMKQHVKRHKLKYYGIHTKEISCYFDYQCWKYFAWQTHHTRSYTKEKPYQCGYCGKDFSSKGNPQA